MPVFEDGPLEAALYWRKQFEELATMKGWNATSKFTYALLLLSGDAKDKWVDAQEDALGEEEATNLATIQKHYGHVHSQVWSNGGYG
jgi:hypothetical protein